MRYIVRKTVQYDIEASSEHEALEQLARSTGIVEEYPPEYEIYLDNLETGELTKV